MNRWPAGLLAGVGTALAAAVAGAFAPVGRIAALDEATWVAEWLRIPRAAAWPVLVIAGGAVLGLAIAALGERRRGISGVRKGVAVGVLAWAANMLWIWPRTSAGFFGMELGWAAPISSLVMHGVHGAVLGLAYGALRNLGKTRDVR